MIRQGHFIYTKNDINNINPNMPRKNALTKLRLCMERQNRLYDELIMIKVELLYLKRKNELLEKKVKILNNKGSNYHNFSYVDKTLRKQQNERQHKQSESV